MNSATLIESVSVLKTYYIRLTGRPDECYFDLCDLEIIFTNRSLRNESLLQYNPLVFDKMHSVQCAFEAVFIEPNSLAVTSADRCSCYHLLQFVNEHQLFGSNLS